MSLINKMLNDLEKRQAYLEDDRDRVLDGLYSAYDVELNVKKKNRVFFNTILLLSVTFVLAWTFVYYLDINRQSETSELVDVQQVLNQTKQAEQIISTDLPATSDATTNKTLLKLDDDLAYKQMATAEITAELINRIESIRFQKNSNGLDLIMEMSQEVDYLVYSLSKPSRTVVEIENAELAFPMAALDPIDPIVAIRYSVNQDNRLKLVLESEQRLNIRKSSSSQLNNKANLVVSIDHEWRQPEPVETNIDVFNEIVEDTITEQDTTVFKGELIKTPASQQRNGYSEKLFQQAYAQYKKNNIPDSLKMLNMVLDMDAAHVRARSTLALVLSEQGHYDLAYSVLNEGLIQFPGQIDWSKMMARLLFKQGKIVEAAEVLNKHTPPLASNTDYYAMQAATLQKLNDHANSARIYRDLLQVNPLRAVWWMGLGISLESMKRYDDALYAYQKAINNPALAGESKEFVSQRLSTLSNLIKDESS